MPTTSPAASVPTTEGSAGLKSFLARNAVVIRWVSLAMLLVALVLIMRVLPVERAFGLIHSGIDGLGLWGPVILGLLYVLATLLFIPGSVLTLASGAIYGLALGTVIVSLASTTGAALAFLIARYAARDRVRRTVEQSPKLAAIDQAIGEQGWKIVALLRLSPAVPFNLQNYLYGVTSIRFWPCVLASWLAMLPGTFLYIYVGSLGKTAAAGQSTSAAEWALRGVGLLATVAVTVYIARVARNAIQQRTHIRNDDERPGESSGSVPSCDGDDAFAAAETGWPWSTLVMALLAAVLLTSAGWAFIQQERIRQSVERWLGAPPTVVSVEAYEARPDGPTVDHATFDALLREHVDADGWVDYQSLQGNPAPLDRYLGELADAPFESLGRNEKLALLINAYNAFTLRLILDHWPLESIQDIPQDQRWEAARWQVGSHVWSLKQLEHEQIRPKFVEPRVHFALVCAAIGCPPLRNEAYAADRLEEQLASQTEYVHSHPRWFRYDAGGNVVSLTKLYDWYRTDFTQQAPSVLDYAARFVPSLQQTLDPGRRPAIRWLDYDWRLNSRQNKAGQ
ncbi:MAG: VTT domain-containing protein [Planctomycetaceae bacterium]